MTGVSKIAPEFAGAGKTSGEVGGFFQGTNAAKEAAEGTFGNRLSALEARLVDTQGHPYIQTPELQVAYRQLMKAGLKDPLLAAQAKELAPTTQGFLPQQAAKIISLTGERLGASQTGLGHLKDQAVDDLVTSVENSLPQTAKGMLPEARGGYARAMALKDLLQGHFKSTDYGYKLDLPGLQRAISEDPSIINRLGGQQSFEALLEVLTRGASKKPGFADMPAGNWNFVPVSETGVKATLLKHLLQRYRYVGKKPLTVPAGAKAGLGIATTLTAGRKGQEEE
jgi:hypothetical protein